MKVLVTGGKGFIGRPVVAALLAADYEVAIIDYRTDSPNIPNTRCHSVDICNDKEVDQVFNMERPEYVIHLAAQVNVNNSLENPGFDAKSNILGTINILECCRKYNVQKIIYASTAAVYGEPIYLGIDEEHPVEPISFYGLSKLSAERYILSFSKLYQMKFTILRYSNVYGPTSSHKETDDVISLFHNRLLENKAPIIYGDGNQTRDYIYVSDVADANLAAIKQADNQILNISTNKPTTLNELVALLSHFTDKKNPPQYVDNRDGDIIHSYLDNTKALSQLDWKINYPLESGLGTFYTNQNRGE
ncbi:NAD-dependent epimerase/dehydratase family protein [Virgibacillus necropolis]|uniref:UDP-glucose 4-epimerase n=1 Tax=Virgibacillus necropolis TaxID=163877 RepID=A0A221MB00_9BACI|nr:NAD-dependent epimerase/dehydratase family protein [Virgibacillus necropolis]ASN04792.1 UDP-glucose 4-epimerase [Virgibacillus necropolis]